MSQKVPNQPYWLGLLSLEEERSLGIWGPHHLLSLRA
jgi:hypothetical protein